MHAARSFRQLQRRAHPRPHGDLPISSAAGILRDTLEDDRLMLDPHAVLPEDGQGPLGMIVEVAV